VNVTKASKWPFKAHPPAGSPEGLPPIEAGTVDLDRQATCVGCGCTDAHGCRAGCTWLAVNRAQATGVCSNCAEHLQDWTKENT
jgi:hypothetical protein